jgi:hypothetical protein
MTELINIACRADMIASARSINKGNGQEVFEYAYNRLLTEVYERHPSRPSAINIKTQLQIELSVGRYIITSLFI